MILYPYTILPTIVISFPYRVDEVLDTNSNTVKRMLHTKTALSICYIIACNNSGYFASQQDRATAVKIETDFLDNEKVFYHLSDETIPVFYPLCTKFRNWKFPYDGPLEDWVATASDPTDDVPGMVLSSMSGAVKYRDKACRVTGYLNCLKACHLIPSAEETWVCAFFLPVLQHMSTQPPQFLRNGMEKYAISPKAKMDDLRNSIALRADFHYAFDTGSYAFAPRDGTMRVYFISDHLNNYMQYHDHSISTANIHVNFLYARFAWAVLKNTEAALKRQEQHFNILGNSRGPNGDADEGGDDGDGASKSGSGKRARNSTKRRRAGNQDNEQQFKMQKTGVQGPADDMDSGTDSETDSDLDQARFPFFCKLSFLDE